ncbi:MAG TPA: biotin-dependent carboxyltransferase family protein [Candidatus Polarisedimenticolia bacterium]|nr:biotin-dependent carboxyltransferase family protein [Candidatus Polarisedimenticolia bacterium]
MPPIVVLDPGLLSTIQDLGREGHGRLGVSPAGAADPTALRIANRLVGNPEDGAALEMTLRGGEFLFEGSAVIAVAGADFGPALDGRPVPLWTTLEARAGQRLRLGVTRSGARAYLAVRGGFAVPPVLGSRSTHLASGLGGLDGRALRKGDLLPVGDDRGPWPKHRVDPGLLGCLAPRRTLRVTDGPQAEWFTTEARDQISQAAYAVTEESDRMGLRLRGSPIRPPFGGDMVSEGVPLGAVQVPPGGQPILSFVDLQTTGGYPVVASVISADLPSVGQLRPRDEIRFAPVSLEAARSLLVEQEEWLRSGSLLLP